MDFAFKEILSTKSCAPSKDLDTFIFEPEAGEEELGALMVLTEVVGAKEDQEAASWLSNLVAYKAKNSFFNVGVNDTEEGVQRACQSLNEKLKHLKQEGELSWVDDFNVLIASLSPQGSLFITRIGKGGAYIAQGEELANIDSQLPSSNDSYLFEQMGEADLNTKNSLLLFSSNLASLPEKEQRKYLQTILGFSSKKSKEKLSEADFNCFAGLVCELNPKSKKISLNWKLLFEKVVTGARAFLLAFQKSFQKLARIFDSFKKRFFALFKKIKKIKPQKSFSSKANTNYLSFLNNKKTKMGLLGFVVVLILAGIGFCPPKYFTGKEKKTSPVKKPPKLPPKVQIAFDLSSTSTPAFPVRSLLISEGELWALGSDKLQPLNSSQKVIFEENLDYDFSAGVYGYKKDKFYLFSEPNLLAVYNLETATSGTKEIYIPTTMERVHSLGYFRDNLYLLAPQKKQIVKYPDMALNTPRYWFSNEASKGLVNPVSFTIDGSIYILDSKRGLEEYRVGSKIDEYPLDASAISSNSKLYTREGFSNLYLYQPKGVLKIFKKEEKKTTEQLEVPAQARDFVVAKEEDTAYILGEENKIYRVNLR